LLLSTDTVLALEPFATELKTACDACGAFTMSALPPILRLWLYIIHARHRQDAAYHVYFRSCPFLVDTPFFWSTFELQIIEGTSAFAAVNRTQCDAWKDFSNYVKPLSAHDPTHFPPNIFSLRALLWARSTCTSRAFPMWLAAGCPEKHPSATFVLCPLLDLFNHRSGAPIEWWSSAQCDDANVEFRLPSGTLPIAAGTEIWNDYGPKTNEELLLNFGFCTAGNSFDRVDLLLVARGATAELRRCAAELRHRRIPVCLTTHLLLNVGPFQFRAPNNTEGDRITDGALQLLTAVTLCMSPILTTEQGVECSSVRNQCLDLLGHLLEQLPSRSSLSRSMSKGVPLRRQRYSQIYVEGQRTIISAIMHAVQELTGQEPFQIAPPQHVNTNNLSSESELLPHVLPLHDESYDATVNSQRADDNIPIIRLIFTEEVNDDSSDEEAFEHDGGIELTDAI